MVDKAAANKAKNAGNIAFKAKDFDTAITSYNTAIELDPDEVRDVFISTTFFWPQCLGTLPTKKNGIIWEFFPSVGPPPPPPLLGTPVSKKKVWFILHFRSFGAFLVFTKMFTFW